jgi:hypothetical protein
MSDNTTNNASGDLSLPGAQPAPEVPPLSYAAAESRKQEILASAELRQKIMDSDAEMTAEWRRITVALSRPPETPTAPREAAADALNASAGYGLSPEVLQEFVENRPVSPQEVYFARAKFDELKQDPSWFQRYQRGDMEARRQMALINSILSRPVKDSQ